MYGYRLVPIGPFRLFAIYGKACWRELSPKKEYFDFDEACKEADRIRHRDKYSNVDIAVARNRDGLEFYRASIES